MPNQKMWQLLFEASRWTKGTSARDAEGRPVEAHWTLATCWCAVGALNVCYTDRDERSVVALKLVEKIGVKEIHPIYIGPNIAQWNDSHTHEEVLSVLKELDV